MNWEEMKSAFTWDGSWRDLYVLGTNLEDWQRLLDLVASSGYQVEFRRGDETKMPQRASDLTWTSQEDRSLLQVNVGGPVLNCHFFTADEIEFDLDPREVQTERDGQTVFSFMRQLGRALQKPIRLTPENMREAVLIEYDPATDSMCMKEKYGWV